MSTQERVFTARVRSTKEGNVFTLFVSSPGRESMGGGYPSLWFQVPSQPLVQVLSGGGVLQSLVPGPFPGGKGYPRQVPGPGPLPPARTRMGKGVPSQVPGQSTPSPLARIRMGRGGGTPSLPQVRVPPLNCTCLNSAGGTPLAIIIKFSESSQF